MKLKLLAAAILCFGTAPVIAASTDQIQAALDATAIENITIVSEDPAQPRCLKCRLLLVKGQGEFGDVWQKILVRRRSNGRHATQVLDESM